MLIALRTMWPLMFGYFFVMLGQGLHSTLLGIRAEIESFDPTVTGIIISFYTIGLMAGTYLCERIIQRIGHIRAYAMASALCSCAAILYIISVHPFVWATSRIMVGIAMAIIYTATESWLNDAAENHNRGSYLSLYMVTTNIGMGFGQFLLLLAAPENPTLFLLISMLWSLSTIPVLMTVRWVPGFDSPSPMSIKNLYRISPFGTINMALIGVVYSATFVMAGVFTSRIGFSLLETSLFVSVMIFAPAISQTPIGQLSDKMDRRIVITACLGIGLAICMINILFPDLPNFGLIALIGLFAAFVIPVHSLLIAHTNDFIRRDQMVGTSGAMIRMFSLGSTFSPPVVGFVMQHVDSFGYYYFLAISTSIMIAYSVYRLVMRWGQVEGEEDNKFTSMPRMQNSRIAPAMNPEAESEMMGYTYLEKITPENPDTKKSTSENS